MLSSVDAVHLTLPVQLLELCPFAISLMSALERSCCLSQLVHYQHKLLGLQQHVLQASTLAGRVVLPALPAIIKVRLGEGE